MIDPFAMKAYSKLNPKRLLYTGFARTVEWTAKRAFFAIRIRETETPTALNDELFSPSSAVTVQQMNALISALLTLEDHVSGAVVEIGSYRGITTSEFARATSRLVFAVDPFQGYGGADADLQAFKANTFEHKNVIHLRATSGAASNNWTGAPIAFVFVDAVHDYVNTMFDAVTWLKRLEPGGLLAMHDTDDIRFSGTRLAAWRMALGHELVCHVPGLVIVRKALRPLV